MPKFIDLSGKRFGRLTVLKQVKKGKLIYWECLCDCGNIFKVNGRALRRGHTKSCGCLQRETASKIFFKHGHSIGKRTKIYHAWTSMLDRCRNPNCQKYKWYGGKGITVCDQWLKFENFLKDMGDPPKNMTLDRIDNDGNYEPGNCRWIKWVEQGQNKSNVKLNGLKVKIIKILLKKSPLTHENIAKYFDVTRPNITAIASRRIWKNIA